LARRFIFACLRSIASRWTNVVSPPEPLCIRKPACDEASAQPPQGTQRSIRI
jgi:hypothetical protein